MTPEQKARMDELADTSLVKHASDDECIAYCLGFRDALKEYEGLVASMEWIMPKVHQGNHEGEFQDCNKATCVEYRSALKRFRGE